MKRLLFSINRFIEHLNLTFLRIVGILRAQHVDKVFMMKRNHVMLTWGISLLSAVLLLTGCEKSSEEMYKKAMSLYQAGKYQQAVELFETLLAKYPEHSLSLKARYQLGNIYFHKLNKPEQALQYAQKLYTEAPQGKYAIDALRLMGTIYESSLNSCRDATEIYRLLLRDYEPDVDAGKYQMAIADCHFKSREYPQAITEYTVVVDRYSTSEYVSRARFQIANSYALVDKCADAITIYEELLQTPESLSPQFSVDVKLELAFCYGQEEEYDKAVSLYEELELLADSEVTLDSELIVRKKERILGRLAELNRTPEEVDWSRK